MSDSASNPPGRSTFAAVLLLVGLTIAAYMPALRGGFIWDDDDYVTQNLNLRTTSGLANIWLAPRTSPQYYPMVFTSFWIENHLWGMRPSRFHADNVLLHALAAVLLWRVLVVLELPCALLAASLFALHPINVESVAWITERKNVLSGVFYFGAALAYLAPSRRYALALLLFAAAVLSKSVAGSLPAALLLVIWWKRGTITRRDVMPLIPMFVMGLIMAAVTVWLERTHVRAVGEDWNLGIIKRILIAGRAIWFYVAKLIIPANFSFIYPKWSIDPTALWQWVFPLGVVVVIFVLWRMRERWGRGPLAAVLLYVGTLFPALGFIDVFPMRYSYVADHFQYHAGFAILVLLAVALYRLGPAAAIAPAVLLALTMGRAYVWRDVEVLWRDTLSKNPDSWMVHLNLGKTLIARGDALEAAPHFEALARLAPTIPEAQFDYGMSLMLRQRYIDAEAAFSRAIQLRPNYAQARVNLASLYWAMGRTAEARAEFEAACALEPRLRELESRVLPPR